MIRTIGLLVAVVGLVWLGGCASTGPKPQASAEEVAKFAALSPEEAIRLGGEGLAKAKQDELPLYAPRHFRDAEKAVADARGMLTKKGDARQIAQAVALSEKSLANAQAVKVKVLAALKDEFRLRQALEQVDAQKNFKRDYEGVSERLGDLIGAIEDGKGDKIAKDQQKLNADMTALEVRAIKYVALQPAEGVLAEAKTKSAEKLASVTFREANEVYQRADAFVQQNAHDKKGVERAGREALFAAKHALAVAEGVKALEPVVKASLERAITAEEGRLQQIGKALGAVDVRDRSLAEQVQALVKVAESLVAAAVPAAPAEKIEVTAPTAPPALTTAVEPMPSAAPEMAPGPANSAK